MQDSKPLLFSSEHADACHARWSQKRNNDPAPLDENGEVAEGWYNDQCGQCVYYILLQGALSSDWGLCSNPASKFDGVVMFEHDGCNRYVGADTWVSSYSPNE